MYTSVEYIYSAGGGGGAVKTINIKRTSTEILTADRPPHIYKCNINKNILNNTRNVNRLRPLK